MIENTVINQGAATTVAVQANPASRRRPLRVAYLLGTSYCGSTLLSFLAATHPQIASVGETAPNRKTRRKGTGTFVCSCQQLVRECPFWTEVFARVTADGFEMSSENWSNGYTYVNPVWHRLFDGYSNRRWQRWVQSAAATALVFPRMQLRKVNAVNVSFIRSVLDVEHADVFFDASKGPGRLDKLLGVPEIDVRVIRVVRDVRAFVRSMKDKGLGATDAAHRWLAHQEASDQILARLPQDRAMTLRYEDLASDKDRCMDEIFAHLQVEPYRLPSEVNPENFHVIGNSMRLRGPFRVELNESWRDVITPEETQSALRVAGAYQERFGYV
ncbi:MAG: sulfotransferase [Planctomycetaceae bacterium]|nr:sulfotransferase [Planctomycetaceae bacterium]